MKAEINNENKAKFFAQYWGQDVLCSEMYGDGGTVYSATMKDSSIKNEWLELKPLSSISDEDAIEVAKIFNIGHLRGTTVSLIKSILSALDGSTNKSETTEFVLNWINALDFLRDRGYLVPFLGLSCEELIEDGWAKYKEG